jgi:UDP-glucose/galactose:(glucosyl)LPS alpha-1,2-glucosyl/galactosyltransferase
MMIVSAADERFAAHFAAMLHSAWTHHPTAKFYLMDCGIELGTLAVLREFATDRGICLSIISIDSTMLHDLPTTKALSVAAYARLMIPDLLPVSVEKVLYLDADCIVVKDLTALLQMDIGEAAIAGVHDAFGAQAELEIGVPVDDREFVNSGVLLMNLAVWRRYRLADAALAFIRQQRPRFLDQAGINAACAGRIVHLTGEWNVMVPFLDPQPGRWLDPNIIHYVGWTKPWVFGDVHFADIYLHHRRQTPFPFKLPRFQRSRLRRLLNMLIGRQKYWDHFILTQRCKAFAAKYVNRIARSTTATDGARSAAPPAAQ